MEKTENERPQDAHTAHTEKLKLIHGPEIVAYLKEQPDQPVDNETKLDTTGTYLQMKGQKRHKMPQETEEQKKETECFYNNAFFFIDHHKAIFQDSRMFLTPLPIVNALAYTGTSGLKNPTLGVYLEWWMVVKEAVAFKDGELHEVICRFSGSPLSGSNQCVYASEDRTINVRPSDAQFLKVWQSFMDFNKYYDEAKAKYQSYSCLEEVAQALMEQEAAQNKNNPPQSE